MEFSCSKMAFFERALAMLEKNPSPTPAMRVVGDKVYFRGHSRGLTTVNKGGFLVRFHAKGGGFFTPFSTVAEYSRPVIS